jgi:hypothetical protein
LEYLFIIFLVRQWPKEELLKQLRKLWNLLSYIGFSCLGSVCIGRFIFGLLHVFSRTPLTIRSIFILLGDKIYGRIGDAIDILLFLLLYLVWLLL